MKDYSKPQIAKVLWRKSENSQTTSLRLKLAGQNQKKFKFIAGQFMMVGIPGFGEAAFTLSSAPQKSDQYFEICVRAVGELTRKLNKQKRGMTLTVRGPYGNGFLQARKNLILIGGGCGFIPLKSVLLEYLEQKNIQMQVLLGCKNKQTLLFEDQYEKWREKIDFNVILEETDNKKNAGFVTDLIKNRNLLEDSLVFVCGPEVMYKFVAKELLAKKVLSKNMYFSLERRMCCGQGICQHCAIGEKYVCKDGPVFDYEFLKNLEKHEIDI